MILPDVRDPRLITVRRGGTLTDADHQALALWAADCAEHVLPLFEQSEPQDPLPRTAIDATRIWARGDAAMMETRALGGHVMGAVRPLRGAARFAAYAAGQAACVAQVPEHDLGAAAYTIEAVYSAAQNDSRDEARLTERDWQRAQLPDDLRDFVLDDQRRRNNICWNMFDD
ncbi:putative immunity protein [Gordonia hydrophobica]|uniref:Imm-5-like domain-containing protein n=1 Tax=Gordonia hydrophobica TaxID=40516 RepID=A0ABZ2U5Z6_9ACTN|nr:hypothetical protein [Gordonia hydrophobica]MBM7369539.1 hypothetical protein [Gordonia hydrophobica]